MASDTSPAPRGPPEAAVPHPRHLVSSALIGLATVLAVVGIVSVWANRQLLNPDNWSTTSTKLLQNTAVRDATAIYVVDQLYAHVDVAKLIGSGLPKGFQPLAGPASGALRNAAVQGAKLALSDPRVQSLWAQANRAAAQAFLAIVNGGHGPVNVNRGIVTLNLAPVVDDIGARLGLSSKIGAKLPASIANLEVLRSDQLRLVQDVGRALRGLALSLAIIVPVLYALAIAAARGRRRRTLMSVGFAIVIAGVLVLVANAILRSQIPASVVKDASLRPAAGAVVAIATSMLLEIAGEVVIVGAALVLAAWLAGPARLPVAVRRAVAPFLRDHPSPAYGIVATGTALLIVWRPIPVLGTPAGVIVFMALTLLATWAVRRQATREFPDAAAGDATGAIAMHVQQFRARRQSHTRPGSNAPVSVGEELERLSALRDRGAITAEEYETAKRMLLQR